MAKYNASLRRCLIRASVALVAASVLHGQSEKGKSAPDPTPEQKYGSPNQLFQPHDPQFELVQIPAGTLIMRYGGGGLPTKPPKERRVSVKAFSLGKYEVTQAQWRAVTGKNPSALKGCDQCPVTKVSWNDVQKFLETLNTLNTEFTFRLPTTDEWDYARRGGASEPYAIDINAIAWYSANSGGKTHPVGQKEPNIWGLYDMRGNVWEWCQNWFLDDTGTAVKPPDLKFREVRGAAYLSEAGDVNSDHLEMEFPPDYRGYSIGFRVAADRRTH